jgi:hypothetical protein
MFNKILKKLAQELTPNFEDAKSKLVEGLDLMYRDIFDNKSKVMHGTNKELRNYFKAKALPSLNEVESKFRDVLSTAKEISSLNDLKSFYYVKLPDFTRFILSFKDEEMKSRVAQEATAILASQRDKQAGFKGIVVSDQVSHDMIVWFLSDVENIQQELGEFFGEKYEKVSDNYKRTIDRVEDGILKNPLQKYIGFVRKHGPKIGIGVNNSYEEGDIVLGAKQIEFLITKNPELFIALKSFMSFVMAGIKDADKLQKVREKAEFLNNNLTSLETPINLKFSEPVGIFNYTVSDLELRNEEISNQDRVFLEELKKIINNTNVLSLEEMRTFEYKDRIARSDLPDDQKIKHLEVFKKIKNAIPGLIKQFGNVGRRDNSDPGKQQFKTKLLLTSDAFKEACKNLYSDFEKTLSPLPSSQDVMKEAIKKELGLIK